MPQFKFYETVLYRRSRRSCRGASSIAEFGPSLILLLLFIFFPVVDLLSVCFSYSVVMVLNYNQAHEAALLPAEQADDPNGMVKKGLVDVWQKGLGRLLKQVGTPETSLSYRNGEKLNDTTFAKIVVVRTNVTCNPFAPIPLPVGQVPGLNAPVTLSVSTERPMEDPDNAPAD